MLSIPKSYPSKCLLWTREITCFTEASYFDISDTCLCISFADFLGWCISSKSLRARLESYWSVACWVKSLTYHFYLNSWSHSFSILISFSGHLLQDPPDQGLGLRHHHHQTGRLPKLLSWNHENLGLYIFCAQTEVGYPLMSVFERDWRQSLVNCWVRSAFTYIYQRQQDTHLIHTWRWARFLSWKDIVFVCYKSLFACESPLYIWYQGQVTLPIIDPCLCGIKL